MTNKRKGGKGVEIAREDGVEEVVVVAGREAEADNGVEEEAVAVEVAAEVDVAEVQRSPK